MKQGWVLLFLLSVVTTSAQALTVSSFNVQWYGLGGHPRAYLKANPDGTYFTPNEYRDFHLNRFIENYLSTSDVIFFQEVVAKSNFIENVVPQAYECHSYDNPTEWKHQYIVACIKKGIEHEVEVVEPVQMKNTNYRPGLSVVIKDPAGKSKVRMVSLHLKAGTSSTGIRKSQLEALAGWLKEKTALPLVVIGDLNTRQGQSQWLEEAFSSLGLIDLAPSGPSMISEYNRKGRYYDRAFISAELPLQSKVAEVFPACRRSYSEQKDMYYDWMFYVRFISDHCPVSVNLSI